MSGPKHLWSGDWEHESEEATTRRVREPQPQPQEPEPAPAEPPRPRARRTVRPGVVPVAIAVIVIAGAAFALSKVLGSSDSGQSAASLLSPQPPHLTGREFLRRVAPQVDSASRWWQAGDAWTSIAITYSGLAALGAPEESLQSFPEPFRVGMAARADRLRVAPAMAGWRRPRDERRRAGPPRRGP